MCYTYTFPERNGIGQLFKLSFNLNVLLKHKCVTLSIPEFAVTQKCQHMIHNSWRYLLLSLIIHNIYVRPYEAKYTWICYL